MKFLITDAQGNTLESIPNLAKDMYVLALDGSTRRSGICVMSVGGVLGFVGAFVRGSETLADYKVGLKKLLLDLIVRYDIKYAVYEEPFIGYAADAKGLYMIASSLDEIVAETGTSFWLSAVNNKRWKRQFLGKKLEGGSAVQKKAVRDKAIELYPGLAVLEKNKKDFDETDALGLAAYLAKCVQDAVLDSMSSKGKPRKFGYDITICGGNLSSEDAVKIVGKTRKDGVIIADISTKRSFDTAVYTLMKGKNAILLLYFKSGKFGDIILKHDAGEIAAANENLTAIVTRKSSSRSARAG